MSEKENQTISFVAHEADMARMERSNKRWFILALIELTVIVAMIVGFVLYESQYEVVEETTTRQVVTQDVDTGEGDAVVPGILKYTRQLNNGRRFRRGYERSRSAAPPIAF